jgi:hypothetical protein
MKVRGLLLLLSLLLSFAHAAKASDAAVTLTGPWRFHVGDDPRWADPGFDDSGWESVDLSAPASASDGDVGLTNYAPGWSARGHSGYYGYAWYRIRLGDRTRMREALALLGPGAVDSAYQVYADGKLLGGVGDFTGATPAAYGSHYPKLFMLPPAQGNGPTVIAFRVWMGPWELGDPTAGGIHIAPAIGEPQPIAARYHLQWLTIFEGYVGDAMVGVLFLLAAMMTLSLQPFDRGGRTYPWLAAALALSGIQRGNQAFFFWLQLETITVFVVFILALAGSLSLGAWLMAWRSWFQVTTPAWLPKAVAVLTLLLFAAQLLANPWLLHATLPQLAAAGVGYLITTVRLAFLLLLILIVAQGIRRSGRAGWYALPAVLAIATVLFSSELAAMHVPGIWYPWGIGVSLSEYASVVFVLLLFALLLRRLWAYADHARARPMRASPAGP